MNEYASAGFRNVKAETMKDAARIFAMREARKVYGSRADVRTCTQGSYAENGTFAAYSAFIGITKGNETTGHNIHLTVYLSK